MLYQGIIGGGSSPVEPVDLSPVLLWTNPSPTSAFVAQIVNLDLTEYAGVIIEFNRGISEDARFLANRSFIKKGETNLGAGHLMGVYPAARNVNCNDTGVTFGGGHASESSDNVIIPVKIYGVKEYVVEPVVGDLLWTNANPSAELAETQISGDYTKYKSIIVKAKGNTASDFTSESNIPKSSSTFSGGLCFYASSGTNLYRAVVFTNEKITIGAGKYEAGGVSSENNGSAIPLEIYGIE